MIRLALPGVIVLLAACGGAADTPEEAGKAADPVVAPAAKASRSVSHECDGDLNVTAVYGTGADGRPDVAIFIQGTDFQMKSVPAPSGARYATEFGLEAGKALIWWDQGGKALLQQAPEAAMAEPAAATTLRTCAIKSDQNP